MIKDRPAVETAQEAEPSRFRFSAESFERVAELGIFGPEARLELVGGEVYAMSAIGVRHASAVARLHKRLERLYGERAHVWSQNPVRLASDSTLQPDLALLELPASLYDERLPEPGDVLLLVEVSDSTLVYDRSVKLPLYAAAGIKEVWILNLNNDWLETYRDPQDAEYLTRTTIRRGEPVTPLAFPDEPAEWA